MIVGLDVLTGRAGMHVCVLLGVCWKFEFLLFPGPLLLFPGDERRAAEFSLLPGHVTAAVVKN